MPQAGEGAARPGGREDARAQRDESVAKILQEFDDLREAARAEMEAMRNLIQAERELREAIMAPRQPPAHPGWRAPGATQDPYAPAPQYPRY
jgi:frataxin-like iron-binding protein CyaY